MSGRATPGSRRAAGSTSRGTARSRRNRGLAFGRAREEGEHGVMIEHGPRGLGVILYVDVNDLDMFYNAAKNAEFHLMYAPQDEPWGDRTFRFVDPFGYDWWFAQRIDKTYKPG